ncbi:MULTISPECIES: BACON domain-containing carbohydrate-binding protein [unclassified Dysgonomonas]|uniref:BACON domain-containing protein n=1 Tax=unclassified Dysgonomonas TaxID=2630389 RepID=UPI0024734FBA|nr:MULTISPECIES: BACON domain-containing carbohydrate-binding protein [unclassified Dysgonomonas]MDL2302948.1 hypothetical protein [Dysgonomonas sp. OttesenSCG-928-D17]
MKKIINILLFVTLGLFIVSCEKDTGVDIPAPKLKVIESNVLFDQEGGSGFIKVEAEENISATTEQDWININISNKTVNVTVGPNNNIGGRSGIVTIKSGSEKIEMSVIQLSSLFYLENEEDYSLLFPLKGSTLEIPYVGNLPLSFSSQDTWVKAISANDGIIKITVDPYTAKRTSKVFASVTFEDGHKKEITINITQDLDYADLLGEWEMTYNPSSTSTVVNKKDIVFNEANVNNQYDVTGLGLNSTLRVIYNTTNKNLEIYPSQDMGPYPADTSRKLSILVWTADGYISWGAANYYKGVKNSNTSDLSFTFTDSGTYAGKVIVGLYGIHTSVIPVASGTYSALSSLHHCNISIVKK